MSTTLKFDEESRMCTIEFDFVSGRYLSVEIDSPWSGDTESGFGSIERFNLTLDQAKDLHKALGEWLAHR